MALFSSLFSADMLVLVMVALACAYVFHTWQIARKAKASNAGCGTGGSCSTCGACNTIAQRLAMK